MRGSDIPLARAIRGPVTLITVGVLFALSFPRGSLVIRNGFVCIDSKPCKRHQSPGRHEQRETSYTMSRSVQHDRTPR